MRRYRLCLLALVIGSLVIGASATGLAAPASPPQATAQETAGKKVLTIDEYGRWRSIASTAITADGSWVSFAYRKREADDELHIKNIDKAAEHLIERGSDAQFSRDSLWVAYRLALPWEEIEELEEEDDPVPVQAALLDLASGDTFGPWDDVDSFRFARSSLALAIQRERPERGGGGGRGGQDSGSGADSAARGADLIVRYLRGGYEELLGSVDEWAFNRPGTHLAYTVDAADNNGNGVYVIDLTSGARRALDNAREEYAQLSWDEAGTALAVLRGTKPEGLDERENLLLVFAEVATTLETLVASGGRATAGGATGAAARAPAASAAGKRYDPTEDPAFPDGFVISERGSLAFNEGATKISFGIKERMEEPEKTDDPIADVNIFHWRDERIQSVQRAQAERDRNFTYRSVLNLDVTGESGNVGTFVRLADDRIRTVQLTRDGRWGIGEDDKDYISDWEPPLADFYRIDTATGGRTLMLEAFEARHTMGLSPDGKHFLYWQGEQVWDWQLDRGEALNLTLSSAEGSDPTSFVDTDWDRIGTRPPWGLAGWTADGSAVILEHKYDLYLQPLDGSRATPLTEGRGEAQGTRLRLITFDEEAQVRFPGGGSSIVVELSEPQVLSAFGVWTKKAGFYELPAGGGEPVELIGDDKAFSEPLKAESADRFFYTVEDFRQFPDYWVAEHRPGALPASGGMSGADASSGSTPSGGGVPVGAATNIARAAVGGFATPTRVTDANPWQSEYKWGYRILFDYTNNDGVPLQGILAIPDDYQPGERRPMIVRFYEKMSQDLHEYPMPAYRHSPNFAGYVSAGYLIMQPDVHFRGGSSHSDMLECVEAAARKVIELGYADPDAIGLSGHSYSGGGSSFIAARSDMFAAVASGAAPINLTSEFNQLFLGSGQNNHRYDIYGQGRYGTNPYDDPELYRRESPITWVRDMDTPLLYLHGEEDMTVGYVQGMEWYNALRFNGKPIIFLSYPREGHGLRQFENQIDFQKRVREFFNHYLRDEPAPEWMTQGRSYLEKERELRRRRQ